MRTWILLADAGNARLYLTNKGVSDWTLVREFSHPESRQHAAALEEGLNKGAFERLILVTSPAFLGALREVLPQSVHERITHTVEKDYLHMDEPELKERLQKQLLPK